MEARFITFEGIEGCGKSTQIGLFAEYLRKKGRNVVVTREPGGTAVGDQIREILLNPKNISIAPMTELLLYAAARAQHVEEKIRPALLAGHIILSDRYADATTAYQGAARNLSPEFLKQLHKIATGDLVPDITFLLDLPAAAGLKRARSRNKEAGHEDRFENEALHFHEKVREGYLSIAKTEPNRVVVVNAAGTIEETYSRIEENFELRLDVRSHCER